MAKTSTPRTAVAAYDPVDAGFLEARGKLVEVAAFFDRAERRGRAGDFRVRALKQAVAKLSAPDAPADRAGSVLRALSDSTVMPVEKAGSPACGAVDAKKNPQPRAGQKPRR